MTWYNPSLNIIEEAADISSGVNIGPKMSSYSPLQDITGYPLSYLCTVRRVQQPEI